jgi:hypothetical protein
LFGGEYEGAVLLGASSLSFGLPYLMVLRTVDLPPSSSIIRGFFNKKNPLGEALIAETNEGIF